MESLEEQWSPQERRAQGPLTWESACVFLVRKDWHDILCNESVPGPEIMMACISCNTEDFKWLNLVPILEFQPTRLTWEV